MNYTVICVEQCCHCWYSGGTHCTQWSEYHLMMFQPLVTFFLGDYCDSCWYHRLRHAAHCSHIIIMATEPQIITCIAWKARRSLWIRCWAACWYLAGPSQHHLSALPSPLPAAAAGTARDPPLFIPQLSGCWNKPVRWRTKYTPASSPRQTRIGLFPLVWETDLNGDALLVG